MKQNTLFSVVLLAFVLSGCGKLFGGLRHDLDDGYRNQATTGGVWPERQMLDQADLETPSVYEDYTVGHSERVPAGGWNSRTPTGGWNSGEAYSSAAERIRPAEELAQQDARGYRDRGQESARKFKNGVRATRADFIDESQSEGSLWASSGQTNYFFTKNSIKTQGDIITVKTEEPFIRDVAAEVKRGLSDDEMEEEMAMTKRKKTRALASTDPAQPAAPGTDQAKTSASSASTAPAAADPFADGGEEAKVTPNDVDLSQSIGLKTGETMMAEIVERFPSGNYKIRGTKRLNYRGSVRMLTFVAIAKASDISEGDTIDSSKLYEYKLNVQR